MDLFHESEFYEAKTVTDIAHCSSPLLKKSIELFYGSSALISANTNTTFLEVPRIKLRDNR